MNASLRAVLLLVAAFAVVGCATSVDEPLRLQDDFVALRNQQTRRFDTTDEAAILRACAAVLQDLGFILEDTEPDVGLISAGKERTAVDPTERALAIGLTLWMCTSPAAFVASGGDPTVAFDVRQQLRACLVTRPVANGIVVRVTFQRDVWDNEGELSGREPLQEPKHYEEFFDRLARTVFLHAHEL